MGRFATRTLAAGAHEKAGDVCERSEEAGQRLRWLGPAFFLALQNILGLQKYTQ